MEYYKVQYKATTNGCPFYFQIDRDEIAIDTSFSIFYFYFISLLICFLNMLWWFDFFDARTRWEDGEVNLRKRRGKVVCTYQYYKTKQRSSFWLGKANGISSSSTTTTGSCREHRVTPLIVYLFIYWFIIFYESIP